MIKFIRKLQKFGLQHWGRYYSLYKGFVADNEDPDGRGRLKIKVPQIYGEGRVPNEWALPKGQFTGEGIGFFAIPNKDDPVWVMFEEGDPRFPVWEYGWRMEGQKLGEGKPAKKIFQTTGEHRIEVDDEKDHIRIYLKDGKTIELEGSNIHLGTEGGADQPAVLGDDQKKVLENTLKAIRQITVPTAMGPSGTPNNAAVFQQIENNLKKILSNSVTLDK